MQQVFKFECKFLFGCLKVLFQWELKANKSKGLAEMGWGLDVVCGFIV